MVQIRAFYINLGRDTDRLTFMEAELAQAGVIADRIVAIDGKAIPHPYASYFPAKSHLSPGQKGCSASHLKALRMFLDGNDDAALIMEDDARLDPDLANITSAALRNAPPGWDMIKLCRASKRAVRTIADLGGERRLVRYSKVPVGRAGYLVSRNGATKLLIPREMVSPGDVEIAHPWRLGLDIYGIEPPVISQARNEFSSTIGAKRGGAPWHWRCLPDPRRVVFNIRALGLRGWAQCLLWNIKRSKQPVTPSTLR